MCDPTSIALLVASAVLTTAGTVYQNKTQNNFIKEQSRQNNFAAELAANAREAERLRQRDLEKKGLQPFEDSLNAIAPDDMAAKIAAMADARTEETDARAPALTAVNLPGQSSDTDLNRQIGERVAKGVAEGRERIKALNRLSAYGSAFGDAGRSIADNALELQGVNSFRRGSLGAAAQEQGVGPANVRMGSTLPGDIMVGVGQVLGAASGSFGGAGASSAAPLTSPTPVPRPFGLGG